MLCAHFVFTNCDAQRCRDAMVFVQMSVLSRAQKEHVIRGDVHALRMRAIAAAFYVRGCLRMQCAMSSTQSLRANFRRIFRA